jgi:hypothetical protein
MPEPRRRIAGQSATKSPLSNRQIQTNFRSVPALPVGKKYGKDLALIRMASFLIEDAMRSSQNRKRRTRKVSLQSFGIVGGSPVRSQNSPGRLRVSGRTA